ncbi:MAG: M20/M25/M40 family metallo-hydrolase [Candidatus Marsarchaeota archaeon]|nr:M20/M25/M40 family metallo-hydrolase [Candidatus Marsarchaeota archaeon]
MDTENILRGLVGIDSVYGNEAKIGAYLESYLKRLGFRTRRRYFASMRFNILAERGSGPNPVLFYGHMDTVTMHGKWKGSPFGLLHEGDRLYGLGSCDMKGGIAALLKSLEGNRSRMIKVLLCSDEENISTGAWHAVKRDHKWLRDAVLMVSCEPGDSKWHTGGANVVTIGRRGNAIEEAAKIVVASKSFRLRSHRNLGRENIFVRNVSGESESALDLPDKAHLEFDVQTVPPSTNEDARRRVVDLIQKLRDKGRLNPETEVAVRIKERSTPYIEPYINDTSNPRIRKVLGIIRENLSEPVINYGSSVADDNIFANSIRRPVITIGPKGGNEHAQNEWVSLNSLNELVKVYELIAAQV